MRFKKVKAVDFCDSVRDGTHDSPKKIENGYKLITSKHIKNNYLDFDNAYCISEEDYNKINSRSIVEINDILYSMIGTVGLIHRVKIQPDYAIKNIGLFKIKDEVKSKWLFYYMKTPKMIKYIKSVLAGSTQQYITLNNLRELPVEVPEDEVDIKKIIKIIENIDRKIELNNQINDNLQELINNLYHNYFDSLDEFVRAEDIADITIGKTPPRNIKECFTTNGEDVKWVSITDLGKSGLYILDTSEKLTFESVNKYNVKIIPEETIILSFKLTVGRIAITNEEMATNEAIAHFKLKDDRYKWFLYSYLKNFDYGCLGSTSSIATAVNSKIIKSMPIGVPNIKQLKKYNFTVSDLFKRIKENELNNQNLIELRDTLLPKLLNGEIDLENVEI